MLRPLLPLNENLTGMARPAFTTLTVGRLSTGCRNPEKLCSTVTVKLPVAVFPDGSTAVTLTVVVPTPKVAPETGLVVTVAEPLSSVAVGSGKDAGIEVADEFIGSVTT